MIRPNKIEQTSHLGMEGLHNNESQQSHGSSQPHQAGGHQSYDGPHAAVSKYSHPQEHQVFTGHHEKENQFVKRGGYARYYALSPVESDYYSDHEIALNPMLDVIAIKQVQESDRKLDTITNLYVGSLTVVGLYILYRYLHK